MTYPTLKMSRIYRYLFCLLLMMAGSYHADAQQYPVTASTQIIPPYSVYLPDYAVPGSDKLRVILVQNDLTLPSYDIRLQMTVEQNGSVIMRSSPAFVPKPLTLSPGIPTIIGGIDLVDYLNPANIEFSGGFSREIYEKNRSLPEGAYRISFTAYDYRRPQVQVSNVGANVFFFRKSDPPLLNLPICNSRVEKLDPQFLTFNWSSRNSPSPLPGSGTEYIFSLYEVRPAGSNPDYIVRSAKPIYTLITETNTIVYGPGEPQLRDSMQYVWTVQARDKSGRDMFSNNGLSLSCTFNYLGNNPFTQRNVPKPELAGRTTGQRSLRFGWPLADDAYEVEAYRLQYRAAKTGNTEFDWQTAEMARDTAYSANGLEPGRAYEGRIQWKIAGVYGPYSDVVALKTDSVRPFVCGDPALSVLPANKEPLVSANVGSILRVGNYDVILTEVQGSNGKFTGKGRVITLGFGIGLQMEFKDITVNTDMAVTAGEMRAVTEGIDKFVQDKLDQQHGGNDVGKVVTGDIIPDITTRLKIFSPANIKVNTEDGTITLKDSETGKEEVINYKDKHKTLPLILEDAAGNLYNIDKNGKVTSAGKRDSSFTPAVLEALKKLDLSKGTVTFGATAGNAYGFDTWKDVYTGRSALESKYESLAEGKYRVSAKAIIPGVQEEITATLKSTGEITASKLKFVTGKGIVLASKDLGNGSFSVKVTGGPGGDAQEVYAAYPGEKGYSSLGKLLVVSYTPKQKTVVLVPIGSGTPVYDEAIRNKLQEVYGKIGMTYTVRTDDTFRNNKDWDTNKDGVLQDKGSGFLGNNFTGEEKALKKAYRKAAKISDDEVYLFVVNEVALTDGDLLGKMPRKSQFGFIFTASASQEAVVRTVLHEVGHGDYTLEHTFSESIGLEKRTTDNLMDYNGGYSLMKYQWDILHDPGSVWGIFEDDGDSENFFGEKISEAFLNRDGVTVSFLTPAGTVAAVPWKQLGKVEFQYGAVAVTDDVLKFAPYMTVGAVRSFELMADTGTAMQRYKYDDNRGFYYNTSTQKDFVQSATENGVEGFIYPLHCEGKMRLYKFTRNEMRLYKGGEPKLKFFDFAQQFRPFAVNKLMAPEYSPIYISQATDAAVSDRCLHCLNENTVRMMKEHCGGPEYLWLDKVAQMRQVYPEYFARFTQLEKITDPELVDKDAAVGNWEQPVELEYKHSGRGGSYYKRPPEFYPWGKILKDSAAVKAAYTGDKERFYRKFYTAFLDFIENTATVADNNFWDTLTNRASSYDVFSRVEKEPALHLQSVAVDKRALGLEILTATFSNDIVDYTNDDQLYLKLLTSFKGDERVALLEYIESHAGFSATYNSFVRFWMPAAIKVPAMMAFSNMITATGHYDVLIEEKAGLIDTPKVAKLESDMLQFNNASVQFPEGNKISIDGKLYNYNDIVSVEVSGSFTMKLQNKDQRFAKGTILNIPAIQVGLMASVNTGEVAEKTAWLAFDVGTMVLGIGEAKVLLSAGNYIRKSIVALDIMGSTAGIALQLLDDDVLSPKLRSSLQIACFVSSLPNMALAIPKIDNVVKDLDQVINTRYGKSGLTAKEAKELEALRQVREQLSTAAHLSDFTEDASQIGRRAVTIAEDKDVKDVLSWLNTHGADGNIYIAVHAADGDMFKIMHNGEERILTHRSLANWIESNPKLFPADQQLVLLSCVDIETAQNLSRKLKRSVVANDGAVRVYENGVIEAENSFRYIDAGGNIDKTTVVPVGKQAAVKPGDRVVELGTRSARAVATAQLVTAFKNKFGIGSELALKLTRNPDFVDAYNKNARLLDVIANELPDIAMPVKNMKTFSTSREALLAACAEDPKLFEIMNTTVNKCITLMGSSPDLAAYKAYAELRQQMTEYMHGTWDIEKGFFSNAVLNTAVFRNAGLDARGWAKVDAGRAFCKSINADQNVLVVSRQMTDGTEITEIAHSGLINPGRYSEPGTIKRVEKKSSNYNQFIVGKNRVQDSESKFFEYLRELLTTADKDKKINKADIKRLVLYTERPVCPSCMYVIAQFEKEFDIKIIVYEGKYQR